MRFQSVSYSSYISQVEANDNVINGTSAGDLALRGQSGVSISPDNGTSNAIRINSSGYVGINRNTPSQILDVDGTSLFRDRLHFNTGALKSTPFGINVTYDTGVSVNAGGYGGSMLCLCSRQYNAGTGTQAALYFLHFYYDGDNQPVKYYLGGSNDFATFAKSASNTLTVNMGASNNMFTVIESSVS